MVHYSTDMVITLDWHKVMQGMECHVHSEGPGLVTLGTPCNCIVTVIYVVHVE